jgi:DNA-binding CsgD family transcriptional regulator
MAPPPTADHSALAELHAAERELAAARRRRLTAALARARENVQALSTIGSPQALLERGAARLGAGSEFDRLLVSRLRGGDLVPVSLWRAGDDPRRPAPPPELTLRLAYPLIEAELVTRPQTLIIDVAASGRRSPPALHEAFGWSSYVVATLTLAGTTIGTLHADATASGRAVDEVDRAVAELFAVGLTSAFEVAALRQALARHRDVQRAAIRQLAGSLEDNDGPSGPPGTAGAVAGAPRDPLTSREQEVLELLARGLTNRAAGRELMISEATVKYHVRNLLRKLGATSRADAVSRHLRAHHG